MIQNAVIIRTDDGLTLTSSTDEANQDFLQIEQKKYLKLLTKCIKKLDNKCLINLGPLNLYFIKNLDINTYIAIADVRYPSTLAICFLKEIQNEFSGRYDRREIARMRRPYACIDFNEDIHKMIKRYNRPQSLTTRIDLQEVNKELQLNPLKELQLADLEPKPYFPSVNNVNINVGPETYLGVGPPAPLQSLRWYHNILVFLSFLTAMISLFRCFEFDNSEPDEFSIMPYIFGLHCFTSILQICFVKISKLRSHRYKMILNFFFCIYCIFVIEGYSDVELTFLNIFVVIGMFIIARSRSRVKKNPHAMI